MKLTKVPALESGARPETGPMQFGNDWSGVFIRGDNALFDAMVLERARERLPDDCWNERAIIAGLAATLRSCNASLHKEESEK